MPSCSSLRISEAFNGSFWAIVMFAVLLIGCTASSLPRDAGADSWLIQRKVAQSAVQSLAPDAILFDGTARPINNATQKGMQTLVVSLAFIRPSGELIMVQYEDSQITNTLKILPARDSIVPTPSSQRRAALEQAAAWVEISPAEALERTLSEGRAFNTQYGSTYDPLIGLHTDVEEVFGIPAAWSVQYFAPPREIRIWVNAQTGEIIGRTNGALYPTPEPAPMP